MNQFCCGQPSAQRALGELMPQGGAAFSWLHPGCPKAGLLQDPLQRIITGPLGACRPAQRARPCHESSRTGGPIPRSRPSPLSSAKPSIPGRASGLCVLGRGGRAPSSRASAAAAAAAGPGAQRRPEERGSCRARTPRPPTSWQFVVVCRVLLSCKSQSRPPALGGGEGGFAFFFFPLPLAFAVANVA